MPDQSFRQLKKQYTAVSNQYTTRPNIRHSNTKRSDKMQNYGLDSKYDSKFDPDQPRQNSMVARILNDPFAGRTSSRCERINELDKCERELRKEMYGISMVEGMTGSSYKRPKFESVQKMETYVKPAVNNLVEGHGSMKASSYS